jgi:hypothetical protein
VDNPSDRSDPTLHALVEWAELSIQHRLRLVVFLLRCVLTLLNPLCRGATSSAPLQKTTEQEM